MKLKIGDKEVDLLTVRDARRIVRDELRDAIPLTTRPEESGATDGTGAVVIPIYVIPAGMEWRAHLLNVEADGRNPATVFQGANAYWQLRVAERVVDEGSLVVGAPANIAFQIPFTRTYGNMQGPVAYNLETVDLKIVAGPASTLIRALMQGTLLPRPQGSPAT